MIQTYPAFCLFFSHVHAHGGRMSHAQPELKKETARALAEGGSGQLKITIKVDAVHDAAPKLMSMKEDPAYGIDFDLATLHRLRSIANERRSVVKHRHEARTFFLTLRSDFNSDNFEVMLGRYIESVHAVKKGSVKIAEPAA